ncbi:MAG: lysophospholipid acyltransferase family protein [Saprospiraceae bacterium]
MNRLRAIKRGLIFLCMTAGTVARLSVRPAFRGFDIEWALRIRQGWVRKVLRVLGVEVEMTGQPPEGPVVFIGNHRSYLDPVVALRDVMALPVAKAEVASWPLIGYGAKISGILYVKRES